MSTPEAAAAEQLLRLAAELGPVIARGVEDLLAKERPELLPPPPPRADAAIAAEDAALIRKRFGEP